MVLSACTWLASYDQTWLRGDGMAYAARAGTVVDFAALVLLLAR